MKNHTKKILFTNLISKYVNPLYLIFNKVNGYFEEINGNKYLTLLPTNESKEKTENMKNFGIKSEI